MTTLSNYNHFIVAGVIRPVEGVWNWIDGHYFIPTSATVKQDSDYILIDYGIKTNGVVTFICSPDETLAKYKYTMGASVNRDIAKISLFDKSGNRVKPNMPIPSMGNIWIYGLFLL